MALCNELLDVFESADAGMAKSNTHPVIGDFADNKASAPHDSINGATDLLAVVNFANDNDTQAQARRFFSECMTTDDGEVGDMPASDVLLLMQRVLMGQSLVTRSGLTHPLLNF